MDNAVDGLHGELFWWTPTDPGQDAGASLDTSRVARDIEAVFDDQQLIQDASQLQITGSGSLYPGVRSTNPLLYIRWENQGLNEIRRGDHFERRATGQVFKVSDIKPDGLGRHIFELNTVRGGS